MDCNPPGSSVHGISQERILGWVAIFFSRRSSWSSTQTASLALQMDSLLLSHQGLLCFKMITKVSPVVICHYKKHYIIINYILHILYFMAITDLFCNWKFVPLNLPHSLSLLPVLFHSSSDLFYYLYPWLSFFLAMFIHSIREGNGTPLQYSCLENPVDGGAWSTAVHGVAKSQTQLSDFTITFHFHVLEKEMASHSSVLAWRIPGTGKPGGLTSMGLYRVGHDWSDLAAAAFISFLDKKYMHYVHCSIICNSQDMDAT